MRGNIGPAATARDAAATVRVLARFGPRLPEIAERALTRLSSDPSPPRQAQGLSGPALAVLALAAGVAGGLAGALIALAAG